MNNLIEVKNLSFKYDQKLILNDINFSVKKGDFVGVIGANGSGKSTLIKILIGMLEYNSGDIKIFGQDIKQFKEWKRIGYISQKANSFNGSFPATVEEVVRANLYSQMKAMSFGQKKYQEKVYEALRLVGMEGHQKSLIGQLSGGQQQRVFIARVLVGNPEVLLLDEPTSGIDLHAEEELYCLLARINTELGLTIIMVTHDIGAITVHANKLICLGEHKMVEHNPKDGMTREFVSELYGYNVNLHIHSCKNDRHEEGKNDRNFSI